VRSPITALATVVNKAPVAYASRHTVLPFLSRNDAEAQMRALGGVGTLFAIVERTTEAVSKARWRLYRKSTTGDDADRAEVTRHLALDVWNKPNPFYTREEFVQSFQQHVDLTGEGWWIIARNSRARSIPLELWIARPDRMYPVPSATDFLTGYIYFGPEGEKVPLQLDEVIQLRKPHPLDPYRGMGAVQTILADLESTKFSAEWNRNFFVNSAQPGGIIEVDKHLSDDEFEEMTARWQEQHRGVANAHRVAVIEQGKWITNNYTMADMQFVELRNASREVIMEAFGFPKHMLGISESVNRANAEAAEVMFARWIVMPRLDRIKGALNNDFLPLFGTTASGLEFDYDNPVPDDEELESKTLTAKANAAAALRTAGWDPTDVLSAVGLPEMGSAAVPASVGLPPGQDSATQPATPRELAEIVQKIYLGVDIVLTADEARQIVNAAGGNLTGPGPVPAAPPAPAFAARSLSLYDLARTRRAITAEAEPSPLTHVNTDLEDALQSLLQDWAPITDDQIDDLVKQVKAAATDNDPAALASLTADPADAVNTLRRALGDMAQTAADRMASEAATQGVHVAPPTIDESLRARYPSTITNFGSELVQIAVAVAAMLAGDLAASAGREALRLYTPGRPAADVASQVAEFLRGLSDRALRDRLGGALHRATNLGRLAYAVVAPPALYVAVEVNDANQCGPCGDIDGTEFGSLAEAEAAYGGGSYEGCLGGDRCRGTFEARYG